MGRPPCCDKEGVKKGPWTPEEDIILVSYIQEHGPGNWRAVPTKTGLSRCSKSCRLRWTNYLRPGIKRGNFTEQEEKMIIHLQDLLGNRWAAIASYLPQRTDNDIKNYWNTHLRKKLKKLQSNYSSAEGGTNFESQGFNSSSSPIPRGQWERRLQTDIHMAKRALTEALSPEKNNPSSNFSSSSSNSNSNNNKNISSTFSFNKPNQSNLCYASSAENIAKLLKGWMKNNNNNNHHHNPSKGMLISSSSCSSRTNSYRTTPDIATTTTTTSSEGGGTTTPTTTFEYSLFGLESLDSSNSDLSHHDQPFSPDESKPDIGAEISLLEKWLLEETAAGGCCQDQKLSY